MKLDKKTISNIECGCGAQSREAHVKGHGKRSADIAEAMARTMALEDGWKKISGRWRCAACAALVDSATAQLIPN